MFCAMAIDTAPLPDPDAPVVTRSHGAEEPAVQLQVPSAATLKVRVPPDASMVVPGEFKLKVHAAAA